MPLSISILGAGWLGLPLGEHLAGHGHLVHGSTTRAEKALMLEALGIHPFVFDMGGDDLHPQHPFWRSEVMVITIPPSSTVQGGRRSRHEPGPAYRDRLAAAVDMGLANGMQRVIYTSSTSVYGEMKGEISEERGKAPHTTSAKMVAQVEEMIGEKMGKNGTVLRLGGLVGGKRAPVRYFAGKKDLKNGDAPVNLIHRDDVIRAIALLTTQSPPSRVYNLVADLHPSRKTYYQARAAHLGLDQPEFSPSDSPDPGKWVLNDRLKNELKCTLLHPDPLHFP